ncbi:hypothetical protein B0I35DRAFT_444784 [Stachybotrys elegans]|uniref:Uncharacterized protein n=1 Tax=Stachybotrys elegans TaxID=80388 RepID=A0A8K0SJB0_9HYPO|nr:hypothetical protein B0I35DRAFT_444784 [Stachybotrys elegans]
MEELQQSLDQALRLHFGLIESRTNRQDQWYKRRIDGFRKTHGDSYPIILTPKDAKDDWVPQLQRAAALFSNHIQQAPGQYGKHLSSIDPSRNSKLFEDSILDMPSVILPPGNPDGWPLKPVMQKLPFWTTASRTDPIRYETQSHAVKGLLERGQIDALLNLARLNDTCIKDVALKNPREWYPLQHLGPGWISIIDEALQVYFFVTILTVFSGFLSRPEQLHRWVAFGMAPLSVPFGFPFGKATGSADKPDKPESRIQLGREALDKCIIQCLQILRHTNLLCLACSLPSINWEERFINSFMHFVGFEAWNRQREGESYLGCELNKTKNAKWLRDSIKQKEREETSTALPVAKANRPQDPLLLHDARESSGSEGGEEDEPGDGLGDELARLEMEEVTYGRKRSTKYQRSASTQTAGR